MRIGRVVVGFERADWRRKVRLPAKLRRGARKENIVSDVKPSRGV